MSVRESLEKNHSVMPAKTEINIHGNIDLSFDGGVDRIVQITIRVRGLIVDCRGNDAFLNGQCADDGFKTACGAEPIVPFVLLIPTLCACSPSDVLIAMVSNLSFREVLVPCALM